MWHSYSAKVASGMLPGLYLEQVGCYRTAPSCQDLLAWHNDKQLLPHDDAMLLAHHVDNVLVKYSLLTNWADKEGQVLINVVPKHNYLWHMGHPAQYLNPRKANTMLDETFMGVVKDLTTS